MRLGDLIVSDWTVWFVGREKVHWDSGLIAAGVVVAAAFALIVSGLMIIANRRRAKFVQMPLIIIIFLVSADLSLFHLWRGHRGSELWISLCTAGASFLTLGSALILRVSRRSASPAVSMSSEI